jgi:hypothetical protein
MSRRPGAAGGDRGSGGGAAARNLQQPEIIVGTWRSARAERDDITKTEAREALLQLDPLWDEPFPAEQARIVQLLVERVDVRMNAVEVRLRPNGLGGLVREVPGNRRAAARKRATALADDETITVHIPLIFRTRGGRKLVVTPDGSTWAPRPRVDSAMVKALARAFRWRKMLDEGVHAALGGVDRAKGLAPPYQPHALMFHSLRRTLTKSTAPQFRSQGRLVDVAS